MTAPRLTAAQRRALDGLRACKFTMFGNDVWRHATPRSVEGKLLAAGLATCNPRRIFRLTPAGEAALGAS